MTPTRLPRLRTLGAAFAALAMLVTPVVAAEPAGALSMSSWDPGLIISDIVFYDAGSMSADQIQAFLNDKGARCHPASDGTACLKDYRMTTTDRAATSKCTKAYQGAADETAAQIVAKVAQACGINPRVLLVTMQKEQSLVTRTTAGTASVYRKAMGYGCPDSSVCDERYYGFFNQVYSAAAQLRNYALNPSRYTYKAGQVNTILFHPNTACGSSQVLVRNQATASLYNYTPYQPNAAAIAAGLGVGDSCSSYGNRNFWVYYQLWFGSTLTSDPIGFLDSATVVGAQAVHLTGWAIEPDTTDPVQVHVYVDGAFATAAAAGQPRPDIADAYPGWGAAHGFAIDVPVSEGTHQVCVYGINVPTGPNPLLGCRTVDVVNHAAVGFLDSLSGTPSAVVATGWAYDPDVAGPLQVQVWVNGRHLGDFQADQSRPDVGAAIPGAGNSRGFSVSLPVAAGTHRVCLYAVNGPSGPNTLLGCGTVSVVNATPTGFVDQIAGGAGTVAVSGWSWDSDAHGPIGVHVYVDNAFAGATTTGVPRPDVAAAIPGADGTTGFALTVPAAPGKHQVCVYAINGPAGVNPLLACGTTTVS